MGSDGFPVNAERLRNLIADGLTQAEIARQVGLHPSTISHHCRRHGLTPERAGNHPPRRSLSLQQLTELVERELTIREIAAVVNRSPTTVRDWLGRYGLKTSGSALRGVDRHAGRAVARCPVHGETKHVNHPDGE